jgi:hypothetical protein
VCMSVYVRVCVDTAAATVLVDDIATTAAIVDATVVAHVVTVASVVAAATTVFLSFTHACVCALKVRRIS